MILYCTVQYHVRSEDESDDEEGAVALVLLGAVAGLYVYLMPRAGEVVTDNAYVQGR